MARSYSQYCPMAHALDLVGERWSLLIVRELLEDDQLRYSDLHARLDGCGTNILAARLKTLEHGGVIRRTAARAARGVVGVRAHRVRRGASARCSTSSRTGERDRSARPRRPATSSRGGCSVRCESPFHRRARASGSSSGSATRSRRPTAARSSQDDVDEPDATIVGDALDFYRLMVDRDLDAVVVEGDAEAVRSMLASLPNVPAVAPAAAA